MLTAYVYYNQAHRVDGLQHLDVLKCVGTQTFDNSFMNDSAVCQHVFHGCNSGSGQEYLWFTSASDIRCLSSGDVVTVSRGNGESTTSYLCQPMGWTKLSSVITRDGAYWDPEVPPKLWVNDNAFIADARRALSMISRVVVAINALTAMSVPDHNLLPSPMYVGWIADLHNAVDGLKSYVHSNTPATLVDMIDTTVQRIRGSVGAEDSEVFVDILESSRVHLSRALDFTKSRAQSKASVPATA